MSGILQTFFWFASKAGIITDNLIWYFDPANGLSYPGTGTDVQDLGTLNYDATLVNGVGFSTEGGGSLTFDGTNDYITVTSASAALFINQSFTIEAWIKPATAPPSQQIYFGILQDETTQSRLQCRIYSDGGIRMGYFAQDLDTAPGQIIFGSWVHISMVYNSADDTSRIYKNGVQLASGNQGPLLSSTGRNVEYGRHNGAEHFKGSLGATYAYQAARTELQIASNFNALKSRYGL